MKRLLPYILIIAVVGLFALSPFGVELVNAGTDGAVAQKGCISLSGFSMMSCVAGVGNILIKVSSIVLYFAAMVFDYAVIVSVKDFAQYASMPGITDGWMIARDVMNLVFIFILLFISIATILQLSGYDTKKLLTSVILVALLVNFSAIATKVVIDGSNILALEFYNAIRPPQINGQPASLSSVFVSGLKLSSVYKAYDPNGSGTGAPVKDQFSAMGLIVAGFGGSALILVTAFVLFAGAILFIYRTISLLFLIVLSPIAFTAMAFPGMESHAKKWREELFSQSFFAPAYLFMIYLVAKMITSGGLASQMGVGAKDGVLDGAFKSGAGGINTMVYFVILIGFMLGSLIVAKSMGAHGSKMVEGWGKTLKKEGQGYAGTVGKRWTAPAAKRLAEGTEKTRAGRIIGAGLRRIPLATKGLAKAGTLDRPEVKKYEKKYDQYERATLDNILMNPKRNLINRAEREALEKVIEKKKKEDVKKKEKKDNIEGEADRLKVIEKELLKAEMVVPGGSKTVEETYEAELLSNKSRLMALQGNPSEGAHKDRAELLIKEKKIEKKIKNIENLRKEKITINEKQEKRKEMEGLEDRLSKTEKGLKDAGDKKPSEDDSKKT